MKVSRSKVVIHEQFIEMTVQDIQDAITQYLIDNKQISNEWTLSFSWGSTMITCCDITAKLEAGERDIVLA